MPQKSRSDVEQAKTSGLQVNVVGELNEAVIAHLAKQIVIDRINFDGQVSIPSWMMEQANGIVNQYIDGLDRLQ